ncbi:MAG: 8-oxo-dGTP diphosphatase [Mycobacterium sp.]|jgi:8-oxo-dGTP diphosphatase|nr:8-oxo-dGTP diphosphatase [Mycobacterium sp.]MDT5180775.1 8-oxo-dGTP diphosphatase [Mycobacterium sp.]
MPSQDPPRQVVVAGALIVSGRVLVAQRARPPELAGLWELPGGKVGPGETDAVALARELAEELGIDVTVGSRLGEEVALSPAMTLRAYFVTQTCRRDPRPHDHRGLRWAAPGELGQLDWVPADRAWLPELVRMLVGNAHRHETP